MGIEVGEEDPHGAGQETELVIHGISFVSLLHFVGRAEVTRAALHFCSIFLAAVRKGNGCRGVRVHAGRPAQRFER